MLIILRVRVVSDLNGPTKMHEAGCHHDVYLFVTTSGIMADLCRRSFLRCKENTRTL